MSGTVLSIIDFIGVIAFAAAAAIMAIKKKMDLFGVNILTIITATGGGCIRDLLMGQIPPLMFTNPVYVIIAAVTANIVFIIVYFHMNRSLGKATKIYDSLMFWCDTMGLASFTMDGVLISMASSDSPSAFFVVFMGVLTGIGGGVLRDILCMQMPAIFVKHIYAMASLAGAIVTVLLINTFGEFAAVAAGFAVIVVIRFLAARYRWNMPTADLRVPERKER